MSEGEERLRIAWSMARNDKRRARLTGESLADVARVDARLSGIVRATSGL